jgi:hypothetical protein
MSGTITHRAAVCDGVLIVDRWLDGSDMIASDRFPMEHVLHVQNDYDKGTLTVHTASYWPTYSEWEDFDLIEAVESIHAYYSTRGES